jgi:ABC-type multidrug transport system ATPase subunit
VLHEPSVLLLDEPFSGLDRAAARSLAAFLQRVVAGKGRTILAVTHELDVGFDLASRVMVLAGGQLVLDRPSAGQDRGSFERIYLDAVDGAERTKAGQGGMAS